jgi:cytochrome c biogenesis protein CcmG/thiol:disulfide interchange protein DsbE
LRQISRRQILGSCLRWSTTLAVPSVVTGAGCAKAALPPSFPSPLLGKPLPPLGRTLDGSEIDSGALRDRIVVIDFFATYCAPCQQVLPALRALNEAHPEVVFIGISLDEQRRDAIALVTQHGLSFPIVHDRAHVTAGRFRVRELPVTFLVDRSAQIRWVAGPEHAPDDIERALQSLLGEG